MTAARWLLLGLAACEGGRRKETDGNPVPTVPVPTTPPAPTTPTPPQPTTPTPADPGPADLTRAPGIYRWEGGQLGSVADPKPRVGVTVGDTDGDGTDDLLVPGLDRVALLRGPPAAVVDLATLPYVANDLPSYAQQVSAAGDQTGDGLADLWMMEKYGPVHLVAGDFAGAADLLAPIATVEPAAYLGTVEGGHDLDGDGTNDLVLAEVCAYNVDGRVQIQHGPFAGARTEADASGVITIGVDNAWFGCFGTVAGDLDGDGVAELALGSAHDRGFGYSDVSVTGDVGIWSADVTGTVNANAANAVITADATEVHGFDGDGDGLGDLALINRSGGGWIVRGPVTADLDLATASDAIVLGATAIEPTPDVDGDGADDLLVTSATTGRVWLVPGTLAGTVGPSEPMWSAVAPVDAVFLMGGASGDFDGDGAPDLAVGSWNCCAPDELARLWITPIGAP